MSYGVHETATVHVDHEALHGMLAQATAPDARVALIGFNEYSKHLLNLAGDHVVAIYDREPWKVGIQFRGKTVIPSDQKVEVNKIIVCDYRSLYELTGVIDRLYDFQVPLWWPPRLDYKPTGDLVLTEQDALIRDILERESVAPVSMMAREKLLFLIELLRSALANPGDLIEMGVYQGGSVWYLGQVLKALGQSRTIDLVDVFEQHMMHPNATMCKDEITRKLADYPHCVLHEGLVDDPAILARLHDRRYCFAHYDLGYHEGALAFLWERLATGSPLILDNYGHIDARPWKFDDFFAARGARVVRIPWSEQGLVFKVQGASGGGGGWRGVVDRLTARR
jgi:hypothetical protein